MRAYFITIIFYQSMKKYDKEIEAVLFGDDEVLSEKLHA